MLYSPLLESRIYYLFISHDLGKLFIFVYIKQIEKLTHQ